MLGVIGLKDTLRPDAKAAVERLRGMGLRVMMLTGDTPSAAAATAQQLDLTAADVFAGVRPEGKARAIATLQAQGCKVAVVGDGINDAPAMMAATVGMAIGQNSDVTAEAAGVVIMDNSLEKVDEFMHISRRMRSIALQSAVGGMALSMIGMAFAATGHLSPVGGAISQEIIDILAVLNALRAAFPPSVIHDL